MFIDEPTFILPLEHGDTVTLSWDTKGSISGPFLMPIHSVKHISPSARRFMDKTVQRLEKYLPFDFEFTDDNRKADIRIQVANSDILPEGYTFEPGQYLAGRLVPGVDRHRIILRSPPSRTSFYGKWAAVHELGHALGLSHPGTGGSDPAYTTSDTIMSYNFTDYGTWFKPADLQRLQEIWKDPITGIEHVVS